MTDTDVLIVGVGAVGRALGANLIAHGYRVTFASRKPPAQGLPEGVESTSLSGSGAGRSFVILAVPFEAVAEVVAELQIAPGAVVIDVTNPFGRPLPAGHSSGASFVAATAGPGVLVVKAFNVLGAEHMESPVLADGHRPLVPVAGDDAGAVDRVVQVAIGLGFDAVGVGGLAAASVMEEAARYWGLIAFGGGRGRNMVLVADQRDERGER